MFRRRRNEMQDAFALKRELPEFWELGEKLGERDLADLRKEAEGGTGRMPETKQETRRLLVDGVQMALARFDEVVAEAGIEVDPARREQAQEAFAAGWGMTMSFRLNAERHGREMARRLERGW